MSFKLYEYELADLVEIKYGKNQKKVEDKNGAYPILGTGGVMGYANEYLYDKPSVLIGRKGSISKVKYIDEPFWTVDTLFYTKVNEELVIPKYLYYVLSVIDFNYYNEGTTIPSLRTDTLNSIIVSIPNLEIQKKQLKLLDILAEKLNVNKNLIKNLETLSQQLFRRWFIDFEFPNEQGLPYRSSGGEMVESELGEIPYGWKVSSIGEETKIVRGASPRPIQDFMSPIGRPWVKITDANASISCFLQKTKEYIKEEGIKKSRTVMPGTLILSNSATPGIPKFMDILASVHDGWLIFDDYKSVSKEFLYLYLLHERESILSMSNGSVFRNLKTDILKNYKLVLPDEETLDGFQRIVEKVFEHIRVLSNEILKLQELRDSLLPKLLNGEIEIPDESVVERS